MPQPKLNHVEEVEVFYILPALRKEIAVEMKRKGIEQKKIASLLGVTEPAVSQYMTSKRAQTVEFPEKIKERIAKATKNIIDIQSMRKEMHWLLEYVRNERLTCKICQSVPTTKKGCNICFG